MEFSPEEGRFQKSFSLEAKGHPESFAELMVPLKSGQAISYSWSAEREVDFNIHSHQGQEITYHERFRGSGHEGRFEGPRKDHFYLMWQNPSPEPVEVQVEVGA